MVWPRFDQSFWPLNPCSEPLHSTSSFLWGLLALTSWFWILPMAFCPHQWLQKEKCVWDSTLQVQRKATPERQGLLTSSVLEMPIKVGHSISAANSLCGRQTNPSQTGKGSAPWFSDFPALFPGLSAGSHTSDLALWTPRWLGWDSRLRKRWKAMKLEGSQNILEI